MMFKANIFLLLVLLCSSCASAPIVSVKLKVIDDDGVPIENAYVKMGFLSDSKGNDFSGFTNGDGMVEARSDAQFGVKISIQKEGYYKSKYRTGYGSQELTLLLREKKKPIAMYAKHYTGEIPANGANVGFDFMKGDWVSPYGRGRDAHIYFNYIGEAKDFFNYDARLEVSFPNEKDGLQNVDFLFARVSELKLPYIAEQFNYEPVLERNIWGLKDSKNIEFKYRRPFNDSENFGYYLRVGTQNDSEGNIVQANYVKIRGDIKFYKPWSKINKKPTENGRINFTYYFNPTPNDRNVEFDPSRNLFENLKAQENVRAP